MNWSELETEAFTGNCQCPQTHAVLFRGVEFDGVLRAEVGHGEHGSIEEHLEPKAGPTSSSEWEKVIWLKDTPFFSQEPFWHEFLRLSPELS
jgi:hypothetical protein